MLSPSPLDRLLHFLRHPVQIPSPPCIFSWNPRKCWSPWLLCSRNIGFFEGHRAILYIFICSSSPLSCGVSEGKVHIPLLRLHYRTQYLAHSRGSINVCLIKHKRTIHLRKQAQPPSSQRTENDGRNEHFHPLEKQRLYNIDSIQLW